MKWWIKFYKIDFNVGIIVGNFISLIKNIIILLQKYKVCKVIAKSTTYYYWHYTCINIKGC